MDRQIWALHQAIGQKLLRSPELAADVQTKIEQRYAAGQLRHGPYLTWSTLLEHISQAEVFMQGLLDPSPRMRQLRRRTPFTGILTEAERARVLDDLSHGNVDFPDALQYPLHAG
ncbi:hypothetical protein LJ739_03115 [Aestuariibacter halophilus]|uniref:DUF664 domain-containing protein n=1 Tax=Fluctibacter halophilus TaxID=226011 RepID=A0ABS8G3R1_9ALTE|nr:hypothetical protein [Aestuariibacter halophilus]MCC2615232.1 hypothetical protein [Aestuariibacter halophilus]